MATLEKENKARQVLPTDLNFDDLMIAWLLQRFAELPSESFKDMVDLIEIFTDTDTLAEERYEIYETLREILFPKLAGKICNIDTTEQIPAKLQSRASHIGKQVKEYREKKGFTQIQLAEKSGLQQSQISRLEAGEHSPSFKTLEKVAKALDIHIGNLDPAH